MKGWNGVQIVTGVLRMVYLSADAALGQRDAHTAIIKHILASDSLRLAVRACMRTLAAEPVAGPPVDALSDGHGPAAARKILQRLGQLSLEAPSTAPAAVPTPVGYSGMGLADVADELAEQYVSGSFGDATFGDVILLMCRSDWGCGDRVWRALFSGGALATLPGLAGTAGGGDAFVAVVAQEVAECTAAGTVQRVWLRGADEEAVASAALWEGCWDRRFLHRCSAAGAACAAGVLWGAWLLRAICQSCRLQGAGCRSAGVDAGGPGEGLSWQLQLVKERLEAEDAVQAAADLVAVAVVAVAECLRADACELARALERVGAEQLQHVLGGAAAGLREAVTRPRPS